jgi:hypothetical protein
MRPLAHYWNPNYDTHSATLWNNAAYPIGRYDAEKHASADCKHVFEEDRPRHRIANEHSEPVQVGVADAVVSYLQGGRLVSPDQMATTG